MDIKANKVDSMPRSLSTNDLIADEWNQLVYENNAILAKGNITPSSSNTAQLLSAIQNISEDKTNDTMMDCYSDIKEIWHKPSDWIDIRSAALYNSVYFLVGHSADYSKYRYFAVTATISNSGTYDVFIDGLKYATTDSSTATQIDWQTLALESGWDTTYPEALHTHIVRVTPTSSSNEISSIAETTSSSASNSGLLWSHFTINNAISLANAFRRSGIIESITTISDTLKVTSLNAAFTDAMALKYLPTLESSGNISIASMLQPLADAVSIWSLKNIHFKNLRTNTSTYFCISGYNQMPYSILEKISGINSIVQMHDSMFRGHPKLKKIELGFDFSNTTTANALFYGNISLENMIIDASAGTSLNKIGMGGDIQYPLLGIKELIVSSSAPFTGSSPQIDVSYTGLDRQALITLFNTMPTVSNNQVCNVTGAIGAKDLTAEDIAIATNKGWTITK